MYSSNHSGRRRSKGVVGVRHHAHAVYPQKRESICNVLEAGGPGRVRKTSLQWGSKQGPTSP